MGARVTKRKRARRSPVPPTLQVAVQRNGLSIVAEGVARAEAVECAAHLLDALRELTAAYPELVPDLGHVGGGTPVEVTEDGDWQDSPRRVGF
jgi:hypothetical protein